MKPRFADAPAPLKAVLLLVTGVTLFGIMDGLGKFLADDHSVAQIVWARYAFAVPVILLASRPSTWPRLLQAERPTLQALRAVLPLVASFSVIVGLTLMPLADFTAISFASPLVVVALSAPLLGEGITRRSWVGVIVGFLGVLVIVRPGIGTISWAAAFPLATATAFALYQVMTRFVSRGDDSIVTLSWTILVGLLVTSAIVPFQWQPVTASRWLLLVSSGVMFGLAHFLLIRAFAMAPASLLAPFTYAQIIAAIVFGIVVFAAVPDLWTTLGIVIVIGSGIYVLRAKAGRAEG